MSARSYSISFKDLSLPKFAWATISFLTLTLTLSSCLPPEGQTGGAVVTPEGEVQLPSGQQVLNLLEDAAVEFQERAKSPVVRAWVDNLIVKAQPGKEMPQVATMRQGEEARYLYQRTVRKAKFQLRGQTYNESWLLIQTKDSIVGWVHGGGILFADTEIGELITEAIGGGASSNQRVRSLDELSKPTQPSPEEVLEREKRDFLVVPGKRVGPIHLKTSEEELIRLYGPAVTRGSVNASTKKTEQCTILWEGDENELRIVWKDDAKASVKAVYVMKQGGKWHMAEGAKVGLGMLDLTKVNQNPISFYGFNWEYGGTIDAYGSGKLAKYQKLFYLVLGPRNPQLTAQYIKRFEGNKSFSSKTEGIDGLDLVVTRMVVYLD